MKPRRSRIAPLEPDVSPRPWSVPSGSAPPAFPGCGSRGQSPGGASAQPSPTQHSPARPGHRSGSRGRPSPAHRPPGSRSVERARSNEQGTPGPRHSQAVKRGRWASAGSTLGCAMAASGMLWNRGRAGGIPVLKPQRRSGQLFSCRSARETSILLRNVLLSSILLPFVFNRQTLSLSVLRASRPGNF